MEKRAGQRVRGKEIKKYKYLLSQHQAMGITQDNQNKNWKTGVKRKVLLGEVWRDQADLSCYQH